MQFAVPQFTDVEDKIIGPLTLKQFFVLLAAGGLCLLFWSMPIPKVISVIIDLPIALGGIGLAFANYNGRPMLKYILPFIMYSSAPKSMIFSRETATVEPMAPVEAKKADEKPEAELESADSRLRKLAYLLDQKTEDEKSLIQQTIANTQKQSQNG
ncbi:MAG TPA: PrgI family protein [Patescibacteria group bacterium]|nr:PrgI family protein [Patescibacteria group bacterium]